MSHLLLLTGSFPHDAVPEFLDVEVWSLAERFDEVVVVPARPRGPMIRELPPNVRVDYSLSASLGAPTQSRFSGLSRKAIAARNAITAWHIGLGFDFRAFLKDSRSPGWFAHALLARADAQALRRWAARRNPPSIAYTFWLGPDSVGLRKAWPNVPIVSRAHGGDVYPQAHGWSTIPFQGTAITSCNRVYCVSENGRALLARANPTAATKLKVARLGISDIGGLSAKTTDSSLRVLSVSTIDSNKRVVDIARAVLALASQGVSVYWRHFGDGPLREQVEQILATYSGVNLKWELSGHVPKEAVAEALRTGGFDAFINLSKSEGVPVSLMESQCVGLPAVATRVGGSEEAAPPELNYFVPANFESPQVTEALRRAMSDSDELAAKRRSWWRDNFDADNNYQQFADELAKVAFEHH